jgi:hypothetical protein
MSDLVVLVCELIVHRVLCLNYLSVSIKATTKIYECFKKHFLPVAHRLQVKQFSIAAAFLYKLMVAAYLREFSFFEH